MGLFPSCWINSSRLKPLFSESEQVTRRSGIPPHNFASSLECSSPQSSTRLRSSVADESRSKGLRGNVNTSAEMNPTSFRVVIINLTFGADFTSHLANSSNSSPCIFSVLSSTMTVGFFRSDSLRFARDLNQRLTTRCDYLIDQESHCRCLRASDDDSLLGYVLQTGQLFAALISDLHGFPLQSSPFLG